MLCLAADHCLAFLTRQPKTRLKGVRSGHPIMSRSRPLPGVPCPATENSPWGSDSSVAFSGKEHQAKRGLIGFET